jgi:hypothetical protein
LPVQVDLGEKHNGLFMMRLVLKETVGGYVLSQNDYVFSTMKPPILKKLLKLPKTRVAVSRVNKKSIQLKNTGKTIAMMIEIRPKVENTKFWELLEDNYFMLLPGEQKTVELSSSAGKFVIRGWNV